MAQSGEDENNFSPQPSHPQALIYVFDWYLLGVKLSLSHTQIGTFYVGVSPPPPGLFVRLFSYKDLQTVAVCSKSVGINLQWHCTGLSVRQAKIKIKTRHQMNMFQNPTSRRVPEPIKTTEIWFVCFPFRVNRN